MNTTVRTNKNEEIFKAMRFMVRENDAIYATGSIANYQKLTVRMTPVDRDGEEFFRCTIEELHESGDYKYDYESTKTCYRTLAQIAALVNNGLRRL